MKAPARSDGRKGPVDMSLTCFNTSCMCLDWMKSFTSFTSDAASTKPNRSRRPASLRIVQADSGKVPEQGSELGPIGVRQRRLEQGRHVAAQVVGVARAE